MNIPEIYGSMVFNDKVMRERLPKDVYKAVRKTSKNGTHLELDVANTVAAVMKEWAIHRGRSHEGVGDRERRDPLHALVPAHDRPDRRKT